MSRPATSLLTLLLLCGADLADAACTASSQAPGGSPVMLSVSYDPASPTPAVASAAFAVTPPPGFAPPCTVHVVLQPPQGLANGPNRLGYRIGGDLATASPPFPGATTSALSFALQPGTPRTISVTMLVPARQNVPAGVYGESLDLRLYGNDGSLFLAQVPAAASASVAASCVLPSPSVSTLNFSPGVAGARVSGGYRLSALIPGAACSGPAQLILRGTPMRTGTAPPAGFDGSIHYKAIARLGAGVATLATDSAAESSASIPAASGTVSIDVSLIDEGKLLAAGSYSSVLSVVLQPSN